MMDESFDVRIGRYLSGEADHEERRLLEFEMESDPALQERFRAYQQIWQHSHAPATSSWDTDRAWSRFTQHHHINTESQPERTRTTRQLSWAVAAAFILALGAAAFLWLRPQDATYAYDPVNNVPVVLADGSIVHLNQDASIKVSSFNKKRRHVELNGEAFFEVTSDLSKPFIVTAGPSITEVVGTKFNIRETRDKVSIYVAEGKVIFRTGEKNDNAIALTSGEAAMLENGKLQRIVNPSPNMHAWHSGELSFVNMPLSTVIDDVSAYFNQQITIENESVKSCRVYIPLAFKKPEIKSVLAAVALAVNGDLAFEGDKCIIKGGHCQD